MKSRRWFGSRVSALVAGAAFMAAAPAAAQGPVPLTDSVKTAATTAASETAAVAEPQAAAAPADNPVLKFFANTELTGFVDTYYSYNFNTPKSPCATVGGVPVFNCLRNFDVAHNSFSLNLAELALEKKPSMDSRAGYRIDLDYGAAASLVAGFDPGGSTYANIQQAYASYLAPAGKGTVQLDFGKFVTPAGFEVIETKDNWNYSRSLLFALAIPYYHMGVRAAYAPNDKMTVTGFVFNGWNNSVDNNPAKSVGLLVTGKPSADLTISGNYIGGPEATGDPTPAGWRNLFDAVISYNVNKTTSVALNYDIAKDKAADAIWQGAAVYLKFQANGWFAIVPRYEFLKDKDGFTTGASQNVQEFTLTTEFKHKDGFMMRVEYRGDFSNLDGYFLKNVSEGAKNQNTLTVGWVYAFSSKTQ
jgi:hypothetical protein